MNDCPPVTGYRLLVVNADDYGLTEGVSRAILQAYTEGVVTSTSVLAVGRAFERCGPWLRQHPGLGVGVHLALVGEAPALPPEQIPSLVNGRGRFLGDWRRLLVRSLVRPLDAGELRAELAAQVERVRALGVPVTHLDSHQHLHLLPVVREAVLETARRFDIKAVRVPRAQGRRAWGRAVNLLSAALRARARARGLRFAEDVYGFDETGALDQAALTGALAAMARSSARTFELITHPGPAADPERHAYRWPFRWADELEALTSPATRSRIQDHRFRLVSHQALGQGGPEVMG
jgi:chitin disaccharide deacetylase